MRKQMRKMSVLLGLAGLLVVPAGMLPQTSAGQLHATMAADQAQVPSSRQQTPRDQAWIERQVHHELVMLPFHGVFDNLSYQVNGSEVVLTGQVTRPTLKSGAENAVKRIEGVQAVKNQIEVLPLSESDDRVRMAEYRAVYGDAPLDRYAILAVHPIHIIVKGGHVSLEGSASNEMDRTVAGIRANSVSGVFSVTNSLRVEQAKHMK